MRVYPRCHLYLSICIYIYLSVCLPVYYMCPHMLDVYVFTTDVYHCLLYVSSYARCACVYTCIYTFPPCCMCIHTFLPVLLLSSWTSAQFTTDFYYSVQCRPEGWEGGGAWQRKGQYVQGIRRFWFILVSFRWDWGQACLCARHDLQATFFVFYKTQEPLSTMNACGSTIRSRERAVWSELCAGNTHTPETHLIFSTQNSRL